MPYYLYVSLQDDDRLSMFTIDAATGKLEHRASTEVPGGPAPMAFGPEKRSPFQEDRYDLLALVIEHYESQKYPRVEPDPVRMIEFFMDQNDLRQRDMVGYFGSRSRASEVLNRKRKLTLKMMRKLNEELDIPLEVLIKDYELTG